MKTFKSLLTTSLLAIASFSSSAMASSNAGAAALKALKDMDYRYFVAGGTCAAISHGITTPIDVVKTKIQANPKEYDKGMLAATVSIIQKDGAGTLLNGLGPTIVGYGIEGAMKFGVYEVAKPIMKALIQNNDAAAFIVASAIAGSVAALLLCPMESLRIKQVTDPSYANDNLISGLSKLLKEDNGLANLFGGVYAMLAKQVPYTFGKQVSFDVIAAALYSFLSQMMEVVNKWIVSVSAAFCASIVACLFSQPGDMILTETYKKGKSEGSTAKKRRFHRKKTATAAAAPTSEGPEKFGDALQAIYGRGGLNEFFRGTGARIVHVGMIITSQLVIYDIVKQMLGLPATGSH